MRATGVPHPRTLKDARGHLRGAQSLSSVDGSQVHDTGDPLRFWGRAPWAIQLPEFLENVKCPDSTGGGVFVHKKQENQSYDPKTIIFERYSSQGTSNTQRRRAEPVAGASLVRPQGLTPNRPRPDAVFCYTIDSYANISYLCTVSNLCKFSHASLEFDCPAHAKYTYSSSITRRRLRGALVAQQSSSESSSYILCWLKMYATMSLFFLPKSKDFSVPSATS